ncbi:hypothetical protein ABDD95_03995 [Mucilaginibacter sp. PAMB04274]|uniref:hypothetical protein n=1 Tax=Mucilaginibacter sp. PAMB04274 TaxID=3138568 RepID=UPI0031F6625D
MKKYSLLLLLLAVLGFASCSKNEDEGEEVTFSNEVSGDITSNTTWTADKIYTLKGFVYVTNGATLTIEPGTIIKGDKASKATLVITRGAKINATGTVDKPIVFTSNAAAGGRSSGDWGGVILLGKAPINPTGNTARIEGGLDAKGDEEKYIRYGGTDANDNSGTLKYVRIEYAGIPFSPDNEINGLTMGGVGAGTTIDYVEVYRSGDDSFEWFGGTVNAKHLLSIGAVDDDFDTDFGFSGKVQFGLAQRAQVIADFSGSNGFESDNDAAGSTNSPQTSAIFSNMTIVGPLVSVTSTSNINANFQHAAQIRRNSSISIFNTLLTNYTEGVYYDDGTGTAASSNYVAGRSVFLDNIIYGCNVKGNEVKGVNAASKLLFEAGLRANNLFDATKSVNDLLTAPLKYGIDFKSSTDATYAGTPDFTLKAGSVAATGAAFASPKFTGDSFFERVAYKGAFGTTNWAATWAVFDPQNIAYTTPGMVK